MHYTSWVWHVFGLLILVCLLLDSLAYEIRQRQVPLTHPVLLLLLGLLWHSAEMVPPGHGFFGHPIGPAGLIFSLLGAATALVVCVPLLPLGVLRLPQAFLAMGVGACVGFQAVLDMLLFGVGVYVVLALLASLASPAYRVFLRQLAHALEHLVPGARGVVTRGASTPVAPTSLVVTSALAVYAAWTSLGLEPIVRL